MINKNKSSNPVFSDRVLTNLSRESSALQDGTMTIQGSLQKTFILLLILIASAFVSWRIGSNPDLIHLRAPALIGSGLIGFILVLVSCFKPQLSGILGPFYALAEGIFVGVISAMYAAVFDGIVLQAVMLTMFVLLGMLALYYFRIIRVTQRLRSVIVGATFGILITYVITFILSLIGIQVPFIHSSGWMGIGFSVFVVGIAAFNLLLDFDFIEKGSAHGMPKYGEWMAALGLLVTLVWLYLEILRLLSKLSRD